MALPLCLLVFLGRRRSQRPGPSPTLGPLGPSHQRRHKSWVSLQGPPCADGVLGTPHGEVRDKIGSRVHDGLPFADSFLVYRCRNPFPLSSLPFLSIDPSDQPPRPSALALLATPTSHELPPKKNQEKIRREKQKEAITQHSPTTHSMRHIVARLHLALTIPCREPILRRSLILVGTSTLFPKVPSLKFAPTLDCCIA